MLSKRRTCSALNFGSIRLRSSLIAAFCSSVNFCSASHAATSSGASERSYSVCGPSSRMLSLSVAGAGARPADGALPPPAPAPRRFGDPMSDDDGGQRRGRLRGDRGARREARRPGGSTFRPEPDGCSETASDGAACTAGCTAAAVPGFGESAGFGERAIASTAAGSDAFEDAHPMLPPLRWGACAGSARVRELCTLSRAGRKIAGAHLDAALSPKLRQVLLARLGALRWSRHDRGEAEHLPKAAAQVASALSERRCSRKLELDASSKSVTAEFSARLPAAPRLHLLLEETEV